jgi:hypothetical protein
MIRLFTLTTLAIFCGVGALCQNANFEPSFSASLDTKSGRLLLKQCSRATPKNISNFWTLSHSDIATLESNFSNISSVKAKDCCIIGMKVQNLENFGFQYVGVIIHKKKYIYINAFPLEEIAQRKKDRLTFDPTKNPILVCDGGSAFWGALFDIETKKFSFLTFNGSA